MDCKKLFIILSTQRSGSTYFRMWLNSHEDIRCHEEVFLPHYTEAESFRNFLESKFFGKGIISKLKNKEQLSGILSNYYLHSFLNSLLSEKPYGMPLTSIDGSSEKRKSGQLCNAFWVGLKLMANQLELIPSLTTELTTRDVHVINLRRLSTLEIYVSRIVAEKRGIYHSHHVLPKITVELDPEATVLSVNRIVRQFEKAQHHFSDCPQLNVTYEEFFNPDKMTSEMERVLKFLGLSIHRLTSTPNLKKVINQPINEVVINYDEIILSLENAGFDCQGNPSSCRQSIIQCA